MIATKSSSLMVISQSGLVTSNYFDFFLIKTIMLSDEGKLEA